MTEYPVCSAQITVVSNTIVGELMECPECGSELEVIELDPLQLAEAPETEEGWGQRRLKTSTAAWGGYM